MKRGQLSILLVLITLVISLVIMIYILNMFWAPWGRTVIDDTTCRFSVMLKGISKSPDMPVIELVPIVGKGFTGNSPFELKCKMHDLKVINKEGENYVDVNYGKDEKLVKVVSDEVVNCWWRFGEGKYDFYSDISYEFWKKNSMCFVCARFKGTGSLEGNELLSYMKSNKYKKFGKNDMSYMEYVNGVGDLEGIYSYGEGTFVINDEEDLYVLFVVNKAEGVVDKLKTFGGTTAMWLGIDFWARTGKSTIASVPKNFMEGFKVAKPGVITNVELAEWELLHPGSVGKVAKVTKLSKIGSALRSVGGGLLKSKVAWVAIGAGVAAALFEDQGFNANIYLKNSKGVYDVCGDFAE